MMSPYNTELRLTTSSEERSFASRVVVHFSASALLSMHKMTNFSSLIRMKGKPGNKKDSVTLETENDLLKMDVAVA